MTARKLEDGIARATYPVDIHTPSGKGTVLWSVPARDAYDVPLRCLLSLGADDLLTGRCISGTYESHSSYRVRKAGPVPSVPRASLTAGPVFPAPGRTATIGTE